MCRDIRAILTEEPSKNRLFFDIKNKKLITSALLIFSFYSLLPISDKIPDAESSIKPASFQQEYIYPALNSELKNMPLGTLREITSEELLHIIAFGMEPHLIDNGENLTIVDKDYPLDSNYIPSGLETISQNSVSNPIVCEKTFQTKSVLFEPLTELFRFVNKDNNGKLIIKSAYRSFERQLEVFDEEVEKQLKFNRTLKGDRKKAEMIVKSYCADPTMSEHLTGYAVDLGKAGAYTFKLTKEYELVKKTAPLLGFDMTYKDTPEGRRAYGFNVEWWHWRYRGIPHAEIMDRNNWIIHQYLEYLKENQYVMFKSETNRLFLILCGKDGNNVKTFELLPQQSLMQKLGKGHALAR